MPGTLVAALLAMSRFSRPMSFAAGVLGLALAALVGCAPTQYVYAPTTTTGAEIAQRPAADYPFPPDSPQGDIRLATFGVARAAGEPPAVQMRMVVANRSQEAWAVEPRQQRLELPMDGDRRMTLSAKSAGTGSAIIDVPPGRTATIDLTFVLPEGIDRATDVPGFDAVWTVRVGDRAITTRTPFERLIASSAAQDVPTSAYPFTRGTPRGGGATTPPGAPPAGERLPGTPESRWPDTQPMPERGLE